MPAKGLFPPVKRDRQNRIQRLEYIINNKSKNANLEEIIAKFVLKEGISQRKVREYLKLLKLAGKIEKDVTI